MGDGLIAVLMFLTIIFALSVIGLITIIEWIL